MKGERVLGRRALMVGGGLFIFMIGLGAVALLGGGTGINWRNYSNLSGRTLSDAQFVIVGYGLVIAGVAVAGAGLALWHRARDRLPPEPPMGEDG